VLGMYVCQVFDYCITTFSHVTMEHEVACIDITPLDVTSNHANLCALGLWTDISVRVLKLPSLEVVHTHYLGGG